MITYTNQPQDDYRHFPQEHRRDLNLVALDEHLYNEARFVAELERNKGSPVSIESQELLHKKGKIMQNASSLFQAFR